MKTLLACNFLEQDIAMHVYKVRPLTAQKCDTIICASCVIFRPLGSKGKTNYMQSRPLICQLN